MRHAFLTVLLAATALSGCASSAFVTPKVELPAAYPHGAAAAPDADLLARQGRWWTGFGDARLDQLVEDVLARNNDLAAAAILVRRAQLQADLAGTQLLPQFSGGADANTSRRDTGSSRSYGASLSASYEVDLWGRLGSQRDAARWVAQATGQDLEATRLTLIGTTIDLYWQLAFLNQRIVTAEQSLAYARRTQALVQAQYAAGQVSGVETAEVEQSVRSQESSLASLVQQRVETRSALALLLSGPSWTETNEPQVLPATAPPPPPEGQPAELLARRPDLRAAELRLRSALSSVDATRASFYPTLGLTGSVGGSSSALSNLLANPVAALGAGITLPFLNLNQARLNIRVSEADYELAVVDFRQALLQAFTDVDNALSARVQLAAQGASLDQSLAAARRAEQLYEVRYRAGAVPLRTWLDAQEARRAAEIAQAQNMQQRLANQVAIYEALGGDLASAAGSS
jgi:NodT family efflux transporter outer membrane factor (OMF) lipoprotein